MRVVIADDEPDAVLTLSTILTDKGYEVIGVQSGAAAVSAIREETPDAVIADINMPGVSGYEVAREARRIYGEAAPLRIGISGRFVAESDRMLSQLAGFHHYLVKPCDLEILLGLLEALTWGPRKGFASFNDTTLIPPDPGATSADDE